MTELHLLRHAHAGNPDRWSGDDAARPLSDKGIRQAERLGALLAGHPEPPDLFITSPRVRAAQTAQIVAAAVGARVVLDERLGGMLDLDMAALILKPAGPASRPCLVGHDPAFSELLADLVGVPHLPMRKGAIARLSIDGPGLPPGRAVLRYLVPPDILPAS